jgi:PAS domain-containing protein
LPFNSFDRYAAARTAAVAAAGPGNDQAKLRQQAHDLLKAERTDWSKVQPPRPFVARNLWRWQNDRALAGIRDEAALAKLPPAERTAFAQLWAEVAKMAEPANGIERVEFARIAVLLAAGQVKDESFDDAAKTKLRGQALNWLKAELPATAVRAGKASVVAAAAPLPDLLEKLAESAPNDGRFQAELAQHYAEQGDITGANAARTKARALFEAQLAKEPDNAALAGELAELLLIDSTRWTRLRPTQMKSDKGATFSVLPDGSILVGGAAVMGDRYRVEFTVEKEIELAGVGHAQIDLGTGRFTRVNAKYCEMTGNSAEELLGMTFKDLIHPDAKDEALKDFENFVSGKVSDYSVEWPCVCKDGKTMWPSSTRKCSQAKLASPGRCWQ